MDGPIQTPVYKEVTLQQLRSFYETARLGSLTAAAKALGLAHPTVWAQVHALERQFGAKLVETHGRGCRLTEAGQLLVQLAGPSVASIGTLQQRFHEARASVEQRVVMAATPRILYEDIPGSVLAFQRKCPNVRLTLREKHWFGEVTAGVESGEYDVGLSHDPWPQPRSPCLIFEPCYELDLFLLTPKKHPLARRRTIMPSDFREYPLVNALEGLPDHALAASLDKLGVFQRQPKVMEAIYTTTIRRYVQMGVGIGIVAGLAENQNHPGLHARPISRIFGRLPVYLVWRKRATGDEPAGVFADLLKRNLNSK